MQRASLQPRGSSGGEPVIGRQWFTAVPFSLCGWPRREITAHLPGSKQACPQLEANNRLTAQATAAKLFEYLRHAVQFGHGADASSDRANRKQAGNLG